MSDETDPPSSLHDSYSVHVLKCLIVAYKKSDYVLTKSKIKMYF